MIPPLQNEESQRAGMTKIGFSPRPLDDNPVQRILDALGSEVTSATLDKEDLAADLARLVAVYNVSEVRLSHSV
jgi:hypothetical protein